MRSTITPRRKLLLTASFKLWFHHHLTTSQQGHALKCFRLISLVASHSVLISLFISKLEADVLRFAWLCTRTLTRQQFHLVWPEIYSQAFTSGAECLSVNTPWITLIFECMSQIQQQLLILCIWSKKEEGLSQRQGDRVNIMRTKKKKKPWNPPVSSCNHITIPSSPPKGIVSICG